MDLKEILRDLANGDKKAFRILYERVSPLVYNTALSYLQNQQDAQDVTQEIFVKIYRNVGQYQEKSKVETWVYRITLNHLHDFARKRKRKKWLRIIRKEEIPDLPTFNHPGVLLENKESAALLFAQINNLPPQQKTVIILAYVEGLPRQEIANILNISLKATESLLQRGKSNLKKIIKSSD